MSYTNTVNQQVNDRPSCWGNPSSYDANDNECDECKYQHTCRAEVQRKGPVNSNTTCRTPVSNPGPQNSRNGYYPPYRSDVRNGPYQPHHRNARADMELGVEWEPGLTHEGENPWARFSKDFASGMARGGFFEGYRFWTRFRL